MFEIEAAIFLDIEAFVLDFPAQATALVGQGINIVRGGDEVGQPFEGGRAGFLMTVGFGFLANDHVQVVDAFLAIFIGDVLDPAIVLHDFSLGAQEQPFMVFRHMRQDGVVGTMHVGQVLVLEHDQVAPVVVFTQLESGTTSKETIQQQTDR